MTPRIIVRSTVVVTVLIFPIIWALGYQDHPWHYHDAANAVAVAGVVVFTALHVFGRLSVPPVAPWITRSAIAVGYGALLTSLTWDALGRPSDEDAVGGGVLVKPIVGTLLVAGVIVAITPAFTRWASRRSAGNKPEPTPIT